MSFFLCGKRRPRSLAQPDLRRRDPQQQLKARAGQKEEGRGLTLPGQGPFLGFQAVPGQGDQFPLQSQAEGILPQAGEGEGVLGSGRSSPPRLRRVLRQMGQGTGRQQGPAGGGSGWDLDKVGGDHHQIGPPRRGRGQGPPPLGRQVGAFKSGRAGSCPEFSWYTSLLPPFVPLVWENQAKLYEDPPGGNSRAAREIFLSTPALCAIILLYTHGETLSTHTFLN